MIACRNLQPFHLQPFHGRTASAPLPSTFPQSTCTLRIPAATLHRNVAACCARGRSPTTSPPPHVQRSPHASRLSPHTSHLSPHTSRLTPLASHLTPLASHLSPLTSHLSPHTSHLSPLASRLTPHTSHLSPPLNSPSGNTGIIRSSTQWSASTGVMPQFVGQVESNSTSANPRPFI